MRLRVRLWQDSTEIGVALAINEANGAQKITVISDALKYKSQGPVPSQDFNIPSGYTWFKQNGTTLIKILNNDGITGWRAAAYPEGHLEELRTYIVIYLPPVDNKKLVKYVFRRQDEISRDYPDSYVYEKPTYDFTDLDVDIDVYYESLPADCTVKVRELGTHNKIEGYPDKTIKITLGTPQTIYAPEVKGYTPTVNCLNQTFSSSNVVTFYYTKDKTEIGGKDETVQSETLYNVTTEDYTAANQSVWNTRNDEYGTGCYFIRYEDGKVQEVIALPVFPQEFSDNNSAEFNATTMLGRSVSYQTYSSSQRTVSFNLTLHEEIAIRGKKYYWTTEDNSTSEGSPFGDNVTADGGSYDRVRALVAQIQAACYPGYNEGAVSPPEVEFVIGKQFSIRGILTNCGASWKPPIINGHFVCCDLSIGITETTGPYSAADITSIRGKRGINRNA